MRTITLENTTYNQLGLANLIDELDYWGVRQLMAEYLNDEEDPYDAELQAELVLDEPEVFRDRLIIECRKQGIDLKSKKDVFEGVFEMDGTLMDEPALSEMVEKIHQKRPQALEELWMDYLKSLPFDADKLGEYICQNKLQRKLEEIA